MLQGCRKRMYNNSKEHVMDKHVQKIVSSSDDLGEVCDYLIHLMMSQSSSDTNSGDKRLFEEIEMFFSTSIASVNSLSLSRLSVPTIL